MLNQLTLTVNSQPSWKVQLAFEVLTVNIFRQVNFSLKSLDAVHGYQDMWHSTSSDSTRNSWQFFETIAFTPLTKDAAQADQGISEVAGKRLTMLCCQGSAADLQNAVALK